MDHQQAANEDNWYAMAFRHETAHAQEWRVHAERHLDVCMTGFRSYALQNSTQIFLCGHAAATVYYQTKWTPRARWLAQILAKGTIYPKRVPCTDICEDLVEHLPYFTRNHFKFESSARMDLLARSPVSNSIQNLLRGKICQALRSQGLAKNQRELHKASSNDAMACS